MLFVEEMGWEERNMSIGDIITLRIKYFIELSETTETLT